MDSRPPPPRGAPSYMSRIYKTPLRPIILVGAFVAALWSLVSGISAYRNVPYFDSNGESNLGVFYIILGSIFMGIAAIESFGIFAAATRRLALFKAFAYLSILVTLMIAAAYIIQVVVHFRFKDDIINVCANINTGDQVIFTGFFGPTSFDGIIDPLEALAWCSRLFNRDSFSIIVALLAATAVSVLFLLFVFAYLRQLRDPGSVANRESGRRNAYPARYNPPYNPTYQYPPPDGPPPIKANENDAFVAPPYPGDDTKPPRYEGDFKGDFGDHKDDPFWHNSGGPSV